MSCGCNEFDTDNPNGNSSCGPCNPCESSTPTCESLPSALSNFTAHFFGSVTKTLVNGKVQWTLPCNLATGLPDNPRLEDEGLACYFLRLFQEGIIGLTGEKGDKGDTGIPGLNGYTFTAEALTIPTSDCPVCQLTVQDGDVIPAGSYTFLDGAGWFSVVSKTGNLLMLQLIQAIAPAGTVIPSGAFVAISGPEGPQGVKGAKGDQGLQGNKGEAGSPGAAGAAGAAARTTTQASFTQPAVGSTVVLSVVDSSFFTGGQQLYVIGGGYYTVAAVSPGSVTARNLGIAATNAAPGATISSGASVFVSGTAPVVASSEVVATGTTDAAITAAVAEITFDTNILEITLPAAGTYLVRLQITVETPVALPPKQVDCILYDQGAASVEGRTLSIPTCSITSMQATGELTQRITTGGSKVFRVHAATDANTAVAVSGRCALDWMLINPTT